MSVIFDSNIWIALFNENDAHHQTALELYAKSVDICIPEYIVLEVTSVLQLRVSKLKADSFAKMIPDTEEIEILYAPDDFFLSVLTAFQQQNQKLSFVDCALLILAKNYTIHTYDKALAQAIANTQ